MFLLYNNIVNADQLVITWNEQTMYHKDRMKYLGITFYRCLSFKYHTDHILEKAKRGLSAVKTMTAKELVVYTDGAVVCHACR